MRPKLALDATNELLNQPTEYPAADKEYKNPWFFKGSEPRDEYIERKAADNGRRSLEQRFKGQVPIKTREKVILDYKGHKLLNVKGTPNWYIEGMPHEAYSSRRSAEEAIDRMLALREELAKSASTQGCNIEAIKNMSIDELRTFRKELDHVLYDKVTGGDDSSMDANHEMYFGKRPARTAARRDMKSALSRQAEIKRAYEDKDFAAAPSADMTPEIMRPTFFFTPNGTYEFWNRGREMQVGMTEAQAMLMFQKLEREGKKPCMRNDSKPIVASRKRAEIKMHTAPDMLPPRQDMRSRVDEDIKAEMDADLDTDDLYKKLGFDKTAGLKKIKWVYHPRFGKKPCWAMDVTGKPTVTHAGIYEQAMKGEKRTIPYDSVEKGGAFLRDNGECTATWDVGRGNAADDRMFENIEAQLKSQFGAKSVKWGGNEAKAASLQSWEPSFADRNIDRLLTANGFELQPNWSDRSEGFDRWTTRDGGSCKANRKNEWELDYMGQTRKGVGASALFQELGKIKSSRIASARAYADTLK